MNPSSKYLLTQSLLSSYKYYLINGDKEEFLRVLNREKGETSKAMLDGIEFEDTVWKAANGWEIPADHKWHDCVYETASIIKDGVYQAKISRDLEVGGITYVIYGIFDFLKAGVIYDTKFSKTYRVGKYLDSPQHPFYFFLCPEAYQFTYLISDGKFVYKESYTPTDDNAILRWIRGFANFLDKQGLTEVYQEKWKSKY